VSLPHISPGESEHKSRTHDMQCSHECSVIRPVTG
jgi:hypothetical protein